MRSENIEIVAAGVGMGGPSPEAAHGPNMLLKALLIERLEKLGVNVFETHILDVPQPTSEPKDRSCRYVEQLAPYLRRLCETTKDIASRGSLPLVLGGDHSLSIGSVKGIAEQVREESGPEAIVGLLWVDAHADINTPSISPSGNIHGMSVAALLGDGHPDLTSVGSSQPAIRADSVAYIGIRDLDDGEKHYIRDHGIYAATMKDIDRCGMGAICDQALELVNRADAIVLSFDLDVIDPRLAPAVATPVRGGLTFRESHLVMELVAEQKKLRSIEVVEFNPSLDESDTTQEIALDLIESALGKSIL